MRSVTTLLTLLLFTTALHAQEESKLPTMMNMREGMNLIQNGFLTNTRELVEQGVQTLKSGKEMLFRLESDNIMDLDKIYAQKFTQKMANRIGLQADFLLDEYNDGYVLDAMDTFSKITRQCVLCHMKLRDFKDRGK